MAAARKMSTEEWADVRDAWQQDQREGFQWLVNDKALPVTVVAVRRRALREKWTKTNGFSAGSNKRETYEILSAENHRSESVRDAAIAVLVRVGGASPESMAVVLNELSATCGCLEDEVAAELIDHFSKGLLDAMRENDEGIAVLAELLESKG